MKKIFNILAVATLISCSTDEVTTNQLDCNCGIVTKKLQPNPAFNNFIYDYKVNCNGEIKQIVSQKVYKVGDKICSE